MSEAMQQDVDLKKPGDFLTMFVNLLLNRVNSVVEDLSDTIDELEDAVIDSEDPDLPEQLSDIRRQTYWIGILKWFRSNRPVYRPARLLAACRLTN